MLSLDDYRIRNGSIIVRYRTSLESINLWSRNELIDSRDKTCENRSSIPKLLFGIKYNSLCKNFILIPLISYVKRDEYIYVNIWMTLILQLICCASNDWNLSYVAKCRTRSEFFYLLAKFYLLWWKFLLEVFI